ncbi:MAG: [acyl-carrier-protein] S-malonyltransferase [Thermotogaceae bacterium]|jgi:[acyl-carrier-protein] S-malonyltransferase|nr:[acyl-carrier-protein] S-malonyltransferase [Thermotogaceae bacterium]MDN5337310.1 [acyl-carrier-protein] S-malonyltransferase [Thermotogaceae bacterium]
MLAFVFPGQGSQFLGMGKEIIEEDKGYRVYFKIAQEVIGVDLEKIVYGDDEFELTKTENAQPAILTISYIAYKYLTEKIGLKPDIVAGHSLGEWTALVAANVISFEDAVALVRNRGIYMEEACPQGTGTMAAVIGLNESAILKILEVYPDVSIANFNSPGQVVISGKTDQIKLAIHELERAGARRIVELNVSGPFHSKFMKPAEERLRSDLEKVSFSQPSIPIVQNVTAKVETDPQKIKENIIKQISEPVRWTDCVITLKEYGVDKFVEVGFRNILSNLIKRTIKGANCETLTGVLMVA